MRIYRCISPIWIGDQLVPVDAKVSEAFASRAPQFFEFYADLPDEV